MYREDNNIELEFGALLQKIRRDSMLTQEDLSEMVGITSVYLRNLEHGTYVATWVIWLKLCTVLNIDISKIQRELIIPEIIRTNSNLKPIMLKTYGKKHA